MSDCTWHQKILKPWVHLWNCRYFLLGLGFALMTTGTGWAIEQNSPSNPYSDLSSISIAQENLEEEANRLYREGFALLEEGLDQGNFELFIQSAQRFERARLLYEALGNPYKQGLTLFGLGALFRGSGNTELALEYYNQSLSLFRQAGDEEEEERLASLIERLSSRDLTNNARGADLLYEISMIHIEDGSAGSLRWAASLLERSINIYEAEAIQDGQVRSLLALGTVLERLGQREQALNYLEQALPILQAVDDQTQIVLTLNSIGLTYNALGNQEQALNSYGQALSLIQTEENEYLRPVILSNLAKVYQTVGQQEQALSYLDQALELLPSDDQIWRGTLLNNTGEIHRTLGNLEQSLEYFNQALPLLQEENDQQTSVTLNNIGLVYFGLGDSERALNYLIEALNSSQTSGNRPAEAFALVNIAVLLGDQEQALTYLQQALPLTQELGERSLQAGVLHNIAAFYSSQGDFSTALDFATLATDLTETLRVQAGNSDFRASYFASVQSPYQLKLNAEVQLGMVNQAFETSEAMRARTLVELLVESNVQLDDAEIPTELRERERMLEQSFSALEMQQVALLQSEPAADLETIRQGYENLLLEQRNLALEIRQANPVYASLSYPEPLTVEKIQQEVLDEETVLLQYTIGELESYLWIVSNTGEITVHTIPLERNDLEERVNEFLTTISSSGTELGTDPNENSYFKRRSQELAQLLLPPEFTEEIEDKTRLLIVADGILHYLPFGALPVVNTDTYTPLITKYEIVNAPSATAIHVSRQQFRDRQPAPKTLAMIADPVFNRDDPRLVGGEREVCRRLVAAQPNTSGSATLESAPLTLQAAARNLDLSNIRPLPCTSEEAEQILGLIDNPAQTILVSGADATYDWVTNSDAQLEQYQIVQFATHGLFDNTRPEFSGLVLSLVDENGNPQPGFLQLRDIFNLRLNAELVVLSACQTGLGEKIQGEGIVGLKRGFMYAGTQRVMTSLWNVSDPATAELMSLFYQGLLEENLSPTAALQQAQITMWEKYKDPYLWAAFTIQGDWQD